MQELTGHGIAVKVPEGCDGKIFRVEGGLTALNVATFALPAWDSEFGFGAVDTMPYESAFFALVEQDRAFAGSALYSARAIPAAIARRSMSNTALPAARPGQTAVQHFVTVSGRAFVLWVVLRSATRGSDHAALGRINAALATIRIDAADPDGADRPAVDPAAEPVPVTMEGG